VAAILLGLLLVALVALVALELKRRGVAAALLEAKRQAEVNASKLKNLETQFQTASAAAARSAEELAARLADAEAQRQRLARYQGIVDADDAARSILEEARERAAATVAESRRNAESVLAEARSRLEATAAEAVGVRATAAIEADELRERGRAMLEEARTNAEAIVNKAKQEADEVAYEAKQAIETTARLEQTARAMKNVIEGYGDQYVVPTFGVLDDLADSFGFAEAGQRLKAVREKVRDMIRHDLAATCDYVEQNRRETAIAFVLDAFNGKVDSILADVRHDNFGTLQQKIRDAFNIVNNNGAAFRNARITEEYLATRLQELHWAVVAQGLKLKDREEQREIKERIREEERAQREFERAMKEAEKEEDLLRKAMEKARAEVEKASDAQKAKYEQQLVVLGEKLRQAEEKNQRALSMAQQTRTGHVYIISNVGSFGENVHKIGLTRRLEPLDRVRELGDASVPFEFDVHAMIRSDDAPALEAELHRLFLRTQVNKVNPRKEFFRVPLAEIRAAVEKLGCQVTWTMAAKCSEYQETLAIERAMRDKTMSETDWATHQIREYKIDIGHHGGADSESGTVADIDVDAPVSA
jgi:hypothetical protein